MADMTQGFELLAEDLQKMSERVADERMRRAVLEAGAKPVVDGARQLAARHSRTGRMARSIDTDYDSGQEIQRIGWGDKGFYGRFYEDGYRPITGNRVRVAGRWRWKNRRPSGSTIQRPHIRPAFAANRENVYRAMKEKLRKELGGT